jgi:hypothetical protein
MPEVLTRSDALLEEVESSPAMILVRLAKAPIGEDVNSMLPEDFVEADFVGYQPQPLQWEPCDVADDAFGEIASQEVIFSPELGIEKQLIYFAYMTSQLPGADPIILGIYEFPEPVRIAAAGQEISTGAWRITKIGD